jgi:hypothetical protein
MPAALWPLINERPCIEIILPRAKGNTLRRLIADTAAGNRNAAFELLLDESDCKNSLGDSSAKLCSAGYTLASSASIRS